MKQRSRAQINHYARPDLAVASIAMAQISAVICSRPRIPGCAGSDQDVCGIDM